MWWKASAGDDLVRVPLFFPGMSDRPLPTPFAELDVLPQHRALLIQCGLAEDALEAACARAAANVEYVAHVSADRAAVQDLAWGIGEGGWRDVRAQLTDARWLEFESFCAGLEHHVDTEWMLERWVSVCWQALTTVAFPLSAAGRVGGEGLYTGPQAEHVGRREVPVIELRAESSSPEEVMAAITRRVGATGGAGVRFMYHGTTHDSAERILQEGIEVQGSNRWNDFGRGFYLNPRGDKAADWATRVCDRRDAPAGAAPAVLVFRDIRNERPQGECLDLTSTSVPTWRQVVDVARTNGHLKLPNGTTSIWEEYPFKSASGAQAMRVREVPWPPSRDYFQHVVGVRSVARCWDNALVAVVFFLARADAAVADGGGGGPSLTSVVGVAAATGAGSDDAFRTCGRRRRR